MSYTFNIRKNVKFHDGTPLTAADIKASLDKIIFPPEGVPSSRKAWYTQVASVEAPEKYKVVIKMKRPLPAIIPALASPFNFIYSKKDLDDARLHLAQDAHQRHRRLHLRAGAAGRLRRGQAQPELLSSRAEPYLDGFKAIQAPKMSVRLQAIRGDRAAIEFRGFPPKARDDLVAGAGQQDQGPGKRLERADGRRRRTRTIKRFQDVRVRQALGYALDRWGGAKYLSKIAIVKTVGGIVFPGHPLAGQEGMADEDAGLRRWTSRRHAPRRAQLLKEAGYPHLKVTLWNRAVDQPYKIIGTWYVDQWRKVGIDADQTVVPTGPWYAGLRQTRDLDVAIDINAQTVVNPPIDVSKWVMRRAATTTPTTQDDEDRPSSISPCSTSRIRRSSTTRCAPTRSTSSRRGGLHSRLLVVPHRRRTAAT